MLSKKERVEFLILSSSLFVVFFIAIYSALVVYFRGDSDDDLMTSLLIVSQKLDAQADALNSLKTARVNTPIPKQSVVNLVKDTYPDTVIITFYAPTGNPTASGVVSSTGDVAVSDRRLFLKMFETRGFPDAVPKRLVSTDLMPTTINGYAVSSRRLDIFMWSADTARRLGRVRAKMTRKRTSKGDVFVLTYEGITVEELGR